MNRTETDSGPRIDWTHWEAVDAWEAARRAPKDDADSWWRHSRGNDRTFTESTPEEMDRMMVHGWEAEAARVAVEPHVAVRDVHRPTLAWDMSGSEVDVAAYLSGIPESMGEYVNLPAPRPMVRIGFDIAVSSGTPTAQMLAVGRSVLSVVESLRVRGYPTEIWACIGVGVRRPEMTYDMRVLVQASDQPVHAARLAFWAAHPSALRRAYFALAESLDEDDRKALHVGGSYGFPVPNHAQADFDEWAPSAQNGASAAEQWAADVLGRRA